MRLGATWGYGGQPTSYYGGYFTVSYPSENNMPQYGWETSIPVDPESGAPITNNLVPDPTISTLPDISFVPQGSPLWNAYSGRYTVTSAEAGTVMYYPPQVAMILAELEGGNIGLQAVGGQGPKNYLDAVNKAAGTSIDWRVFGAQAFPVSDMTRWLNPFTAASDIMQKAVGQYPQIQPYFPTPDQIAQGEQIRQQALAYQSSGTGISGFVDMLKAVAPITLAMIGVNYALTGAIPFVSAPTVQTAGTTLAPVTTEAATTTSAVAAPVETATIQPVTAADAQTLLAEGFPASSIGQPILSATDLVSSVPSTPSVPSAPSAPSAAAAPAAPTTGEAAAGTTAATSGESMLGTVTGIAKTGAGLLATGLPILSRLFGAPAPTGPSAADIAAAQAAQARRNKTLLLVGAGVLLLAVAVKPKKGAEPSKGGES